MKRAEQIVAQLVSPASSTVTSAPTPTSTPPQDALRSNSAIPLIRQLDSLLNPSLVPLPSHSPFTFSHYLSLPHVSPPLIFHSLPHTLTQAHLDTFASLTLDHQFIHTHLASQRGSPFPHPIAHGFLVLGLVTRMVEEALPRVEGVAMGLNAGLDRVRWVRPVEVGEAMRGEVRVLKVERVEGGVKSWLGVEVKRVEGGELLMTAVWVTRLYVPVPAASPETQLPTPEALPLS